MHRNFNNWFRSSRLKCACWMARIDSSWNDEHLTAIIILEEKLGRPICGVMNENGEPCSRAPLSGGRCSLHFDKEFRSRRFVYTVNRKLFVAVSAAIVIALLAVGIFLKIEHDPAEDLWRESARLITLGKSEDASAILQVIIREYPKSQYSEKAKELILGSTARLSGTAAERLYRQAQLFYPLGTGGQADIEAAALRYMAIADSFSLDPLAEDALFEAGQCYAHLGRYEDAVTVWKKFVDRYPSDGRTPESLYAIGFIYFTQLNQQNEGKKFFEELIRRFPNSSSGEAARIFLDGRITDSESRKPGRPSVFTEPGRF